MFEKALSDPTAGQGAQLTRLHPEVPQPILDPTDPRYGAAAVMGEPDRAEEEDCETAAGRRP